MLLGFIVLYLPAIAIISALLYFIYWLIFRKKIGKKPFGYHFLRFVFIGYCLSLFEVTVFWYYPDITFFPGYYMLNLKPFIWVTEAYTMGVRKMIEQLVLNVGMFVPFGILLPSIFRKLKKPYATLLVVLLTTLGIETLQFCIGRSADIDDVIMNFTGGAIGYLIYRLLFMAIRKKNNNKKK